MAVTNNVGNFTNPVWQNAHHQVVDFTQACPSCMDSSRNTSIDNELRALCQFGTRTEQRHGACTLRSQSELKTADATSK
jgi:hypothetical protein